MATAPRMKSGADWRAQLGSRLVSPDAPTAQAKPCDRVRLSIPQATPFTLCAALAGRLLQHLDRVLLPRHAALD